MHIDEIRQAKKTIEKHILRTELSAAPENISNRLRQVCPSVGTVYLKQENRQATGSFKVRGALNKMLSLTADERARGVVASSAGNHAQGVAYSAKMLGVKATIVMPETAPIVKVNATKVHGANVILHGEVYDDAFAKAKELEAERNLTFVHPYLDDRVIAGQGTIALEMLEERPDLETLIVPIGGGGLISGIATAAKALKPSLRIFGVVSDQADGMLGLFRGATAESIQKKAQLRRRITTIAEGIAIKQPSLEMANRFIKPLVDEVVSVSDEEIATAIVTLLEHAKLVTEGSGAAGFAALLSGKVQASGPTAVVLCGGNIDLNVMSLVIESGLRHQGRIARLSVVADDLPGSLNRITQVVARTRANIIDVTHDRVSPELGLRETRIDLVVETSGFDHLNLLEAELTEAGFRLLPQASKTLKVPHQLQSAQTLKVSNDPLGGSKGSV